MSLFILLSSSNILRNHADTTSLHVTYTRLSGSYILTYVYEYLEHPIYNRLTCGHNKNIDEVGWLLVNINDLIIMRHFFHSARGHSEHQFKYSNTSRMPIVTKNFVFDHLVLAWIGFKYCMYMEESSTTHLKGYYVLVLFSFTWFLKLSLDNYYWNSICVKKVCNTVTFAGIFLNFKRFPHLLSLKRQEIFH